MTRKLVFFLRHGQATHNVRAESLRHGGCSYDEFIEAMAQDDEFDADLTDAGRAQARAAGADAARVAACVDLIVASPLSRAIDTADLVLPALAAQQPTQPKLPKPQAQRRVLREEWREISGLLLNAQRRPTAELRDKYAQWDVSMLATERDELWTPELESKEACAERAYNGLKWLWEAAPERRVAVAAHGGTFSFMGGHPRVLTDAGMRARFHNCELRACELTQVPLSSAAVAADDDGACGGSDVAAQPQAHVDCDAIKFRLTHLSLEQALELAEQLATQA